MRIVCPSCQAAYEVPEKLLGGPPKRVRCARCGELWLPQAEAAGEAVPVPALKPDLPLPPDVAPPDVTPPDVTPPVAAMPAEMPPVAPPPMPPPALPAVAARVEERLVPEPAARAGRGGMVMAGLAWLASLALLGGAGWAAVVWRAEVMGAWGASRRLYQWLGLG